MPITRRWSSTETYLLVQYTIDSVHVIHYVKIAHLIISGRTDPDCLIEIIVHRTACGKIIVWLDHHIGLRLVEHLRFLGVSFSDQGPVVCFGIHAVSGHDKTQFVGVGSERKWMKFDFFVVFAGYFKVFLTLGEDSSVCG